MSTFANSEDPDEMQHFIRVYTVCKCKKGLQTKEYNIFLNYNPTPLDIYNVLSQVYISNQKKELITIQRVKSGLLLSFSSWKTIYHPGRMQC